MILIKKYISHSYLNNWPNGLRKSGQKNCILILQKVKFTEFGWTHHDFHSCFDKMTWRALSHIVHAPYHHQSDTTRQYNNWYFHKMNKGGGDATFYIMKTVTIPPILLDVTSWTNDVHRLKKEIIFGIDTLKKYLMIIGSNEKTDLEQRSATSI